MASGHQAGDVFLNVFGNATVYPNAELERKYVGEVKWKARPGSRQQNYRKVEAN